VIILQKIISNFCHEPETVLLQDVYMFVPRALHVARQKQPGSASTGLTELHLGAVQVTATDICTILRSVPTLRMLRHYQLVTALNLLHGEQWRRNEILPKYRLRNLDVDFSHVVCR
jgi:hypothetical protein